MLGGVAVRWSDTRVGRPTPAKASANQTEKTETMCGIAGMFGSPDRSAVERMAAAMVHRGPDDDGFYVDDRVALGFRRLSIIDVAGGHQPLTNEDESIFLVMNGEIY